MKNFKILFFAAIGGAVLSGCAPEHKAPPLERNQLVIRFFNSMTSGKSEAAALQGRKLMALDPGNEYIRHLVEMQESNATVFKAQKAINSGDIDRAVEILNEGIAKYPENRSLARQRTQVRQLRLAKKLLAGMETVSNPESMNSALTAASTGLAANISPELDKYFKAYEKRIEEAEKIQAEKAKSEAKQDEKTPSAANAK